MDKRIQRKKEEPGTGVDLSKPQSSNRPKRTPEMDRALQRTKQESQDFGSGVLSFRLEQEPLDQLMKQANSIGLSAGQLARSWIVERLNKVPKSEISMDMRSELASIAREVVMETIRDASAGSNDRDDSCWAQHLNMDQYGVQLTNAGMIQVKYHVASREQAEKVLKDALTALQFAANNPHNEVAIPIPTMQILTSLALCTLKNTEFENRSP